MERLLMAVMAPLVGLMWLAGPVGGIWLAVRGQWWALGYGLLSMVISQFVIGIALLPGVALAAPVALVGDRRPRLGIALGLPALAYTAALMTVWNMGVLTFFMRRAAPETWIPLMLLSFAVGTGPWHYMASKEIQAGGGDGAAIATFFMSLAFAIVMVMLVLDRYRPAVQLWSAFAIVMAVYVAVATWAARKALPP